MPHYIPLIFVFVLGIAAFYQFGFSKVAQATIVVFLAITYVFWGVIHHGVHKDLYLVVALEYLAVSFLGMIVALALIFSL